MDPERWHRIETVLDQVLSTTDHSSWPALLDGSCGEDHQLRTEVEALLARLPRAADFLASPPSATASALVAKATEANAARYPEDHPLFVLRRQLLEPNAVDVAKSELDLPPR